MVAKIVRRALSGRDTVQVDSAVLADRLRRLHRQIITASLQADPDNNNQRNIVESATILGHYPFDSARVRGGLRTMRGSVVLTRGGLERRAAMYAAWLRAVKRTQPGRSAYSQ